MDSRPGKFISSQPANCTGGSPILNQSCTSIPVCTENNWTSILSPVNCPSNGQQTKTWTKVGQCQEGISYLSEEIVSCNYQIPTCTSFAYSDWSTCDSSGAQSRIIISSSPSDCAGGNPILIQNCTAQYSTCTSWIYSDWDNCVSAWQTRTILSTSPNNCISGNPVLSQSCQTEANNIINNDNQATENNNTNSDSGIKSISKEIIKEEKQLITKIDNNLSKRVSGNILLQVEKNGEGWYVYPDNKKKYYLGRPADAFDIMRNLGLGIKHTELNSYLNLKFPNRLSGKIMLDVEQNGEAYYVNPDDLNGYYLNRPADAFNIMREFGLGITNTDIRQIDVGEIE